MYAFRVLAAVSVATLFWTVASAQVRAADEGALVSVSEGNITMQAPAGWVQREPGVRIVEAEFAVPAVEGDKDDGRCTVMGAGGTVQANIDRWVGQFTETNRNKTEKKEIAGQTVHVVDLGGTYKDQRGPSAPAQLRENYRVLGAIITTEKRGQYFVKFYGPQATVAANEKAFLEMLNSLKVK
jgi:hypothetical protein